MSVVSLGGVAVEYGRTVILENVTFTVDRGQRWGVVGRNGAGKTTLFDLIAGTREPTRGSVVRAGGARVAVLDQHRDLGDAQTVWDAAAGAFEALIALEHSLAEQATRIGALGDATPPEMLERYGADLERFGHEGGYEVVARVDAILHGLGFDPSEARHRLPDTLSGGERGRLALARQLAEPADVLLLDEPTNHLDLETTRWLESYVLGLDTALMVVSHDRAFLEAVATHMLHVASRTTATYRGNYSAFVGQVAERRMTARRAADKQSKAIAAEEDFIRRNIAGGNSAQAKGRRRRLSRLPRLSLPPADEAAMAVRLRSTARGGDQVLVLDNVRIAHGERELVAPSTLRLGRGEVVGLIGPNGAGKTSLLEVLTGEASPDGGVARLGDSIAIGVYRQDLSQVPLDQSVYDVIHDLRPSWTRGLVQGHLGRYGFSGDEVFRTTRTLSGGERARVALAMLELTGANFLVLDEPTNHLDVESIEALEDAIDAFEGTVLLVSHDRAFLRALTDRTWELQDRQLLDFPGGFSEWEEAEQERVRARAARVTEASALERGKERRAARARDSAAREHREVRDEARRRERDAEARAADAEEEVVSLERALADPALYETEEGARRAAELGRVLARARQERERAYEEWTRHAEGRDPT